MANNSFTIRIEDHSADVLRELETRIEAGLEACGDHAVDFAQNVITAGVPRNPGSWYHSRGASGLKGSISHQVQMGEHAMYVGSNFETAPYNEYGTGIYLESDDGRQGRQTPWSYQDEDGNWHTTRGMKPLHMLKKSLADHIEDHKKTLEKELKK